MTKKERVIAVIDGKMPDKTPYFIDLTRKGKTKVAEYYKIDFDSVQKTIGNSMLFLKYTGPEGFVAEKVGENLIKDEFGVTWDMEGRRDIGDWGMVDHPIKNMEIGGYKFPSGKKKGRFVESDKVVSQNPGCFNLLQMPGIFDRAWETTGIQDLLMGMALDQEFTDRMLDMALEFNLGVIEQIPDYMDGIRFVEDWGTQNTLMMGLKFWRRYLKPRLKEMYQACRKKGCSVFIHSCGNISEVFPDIIEMGVDVVDPIQPEVMDIKFLKKEYGKDIVLFGGIGCQSTIPLGTAEQVIKEAKERFSMLSEGGKYIFGPSGAIPTETPIENIITLIEFCKETMGE